MASLSSTLKQTTRKGDVMDFRPVGDIVDLVNEWNSVYHAMANTVVIQPISISGIASMKIRDGRWTIEMGE